MLQASAGRVQQQDAEHVVINQPVEQLADALEQSVQVEDGRELTADLVEHGQNPGLARSASVEPRILNGAGDA